MRSATPGRVWRVAITSIGSERPRDECRGSDLPGPPGRRAQQRSEGSCADSGVSASPAPTIDVSHERPCPAGVGVHW